jgi:hypothetical protein
MTGSIESMTGFAIVRSRRVFHLAADLQIIDSGFGGIPAVGVNEMQQLASLPLERPKFVVILRTMTASFRAFGVLPTLRVKAVFVPSVLSSSGFG